MAKKDNGEKKTQIGFAIETGLRDNFFLLARLSNLTPAAYMRKMIQDEVDLHKDVIDKAKEIQMTITRTENEEGN